MNSYERDKARRALKQSSNVVDCPQYISRKIRRANGERNTFVAPDTHGPLYWLFYKLFARKLK